MNSKLLPAAAAALAGFAIGWIVKPGPPASDASTAMAVNDGKGPAKGDGFSTRPGAPPMSLPSRNSIRPKEENGEKGPDLQRTWRDVAHDAEKARLVRYTEALGLSDDQQKQIGDIRRKEHAGFKDMIRSGKSPAELLEEAAAAQAAADESIRKVLDPEQASALDAYKARQKDNEIESKAQSLLSDVAANADLSAEQREQALEMLRKSSTSDVEARPAGWELLSENYGILGSGNSALIDGLGEAFTSSQTANDPAAMQQKIQDAQRKTVENRINQMSTILTPAQLTQYRSALQGRLSLSQSVPNIPTKP